MAKEKINQPRILNLGDRALTLEFGNSIDQRLVTAVAALDQRLQQQIENGQITGIRETLPTYRSLTIIFDPLVIRRAELLQHLGTLTATAGDTSEHSSRCWTLPVCYGGDYGPDLEVVAKHGQLSPQQVIECHSATTYLVYMIGFLPGFPFMGDVVSELHMPRRTEPRVRVPAGSVAITGQQTAIYPWESPGGWQLLGRCPLPLFDAQRNDPALLSAGDRVKFDVIDADQYQALEAEFHSGDIDFSRFLSSGGSQ